MRDREHVENDVAKEMHRRKRQEKEAKQLAPPRL
jgi:hypothetical protein